MYCNYFNNSANCSAIYSSKILELSFYLQQAIGAVNGHLTFFLFGKQHRQCYQYQKYNLREIFQQYPQCTNFGTYAEDRFATLKGINTFSRKVYALFTSSFNN